MRELGLKVEEKEMDLAAYFLDLIRDEYHKHWNLKAQKPILTQVDREAAARKHEFEDCDDFSHYNFFSQRSEDSDEQRAADVQEEAEARIKRYDAMDYDDFKHFGLCVELGLLVPRGLWMQLK
jgi:hypothetical protein